jgi:general secretion pathway protein D
MEAGKFVLPAPAKFSVDKVMHRVAFLVVLGGVLCGCTGVGMGLSDALIPPGAIDQSQSASSSTSTDAAADQRRIQAVLDLRKRYKGSDDISRQQEVRKAESEAAEYFLTAGSTLARQERFEEAIEKFDLGLLAQPSGAELQQARQTALGRKEVSRLYVEAQRAKSVGNLDLAETLFQKAASYDTQNPNLKRELQGIDRSKKDSEQRYVLAAFHTAKPMAVNFRDAKLKDALKTMCDPYNLNFVFDKNTEELSVSVSAKNVSFEQAFNMVLQSSNTSYKVLGPNSLFVYEDTPEKKKQYEDRYFKTFHLSTLKADRMAELLKASMDIKTMVANNDLGTIQVRETRDTLDVVEKLIAANDRKPAEILLNVEVLELNANKAAQIGIDVGNQISAQMPQVKISDLIQGANLTSDGVVTLPTVALNYLKTNTDARTLSNPRVRTVDGQPAKIHVGDKVPLQSATIQQATGGASTMYEYHDIGIKLDVLPKYHLDDSIFVDLNIEVSSLGQNLGNAQNPAYAIGTRHVHTTMILREGETAILGGLISESDRHTAAGLPGTSDTNFLGRLFSNVGDTSARSELVITVTPRLVRSQSLPTRSNTDFYSGTEGTYSAKTKYDFLKKDPITATPPKYRLNPDNKKPVEQTSTSASTNEVQPASHNR